MQGCVTNARCGLEGILGKGMRGGGEGVRLFWRTPMTDMAESARNERVGGGRGHGGLNRIHDIRQC